MLRGSPNVAARAAYFAAASNLVAGIATLVLLRPGLPSPEGHAAERLTFIVENPAFWTLGWLSWHVAALALLALYAALALRWFGDAPLRCGLAMIAAAAGLAADIGAQALYIGLAPRLTSDTFAALEVAVSLLTGYVGNGLYTLAGALLVWAGAHELPTRLVLLSLPVWIAGASLSASSLANSPSGQVASTAVLMPTVVLWTALVGRWLQTRAS